MSDFIKYSWKTFRYFYIDFQVGSISENIGIACTRKTDWGLLDKWAVNIGGGLTHRLDRKDALMIKENDLASAKNNRERNLMLSNVLS